MGFSLLRSTFGCGVTDGPRIGWVYDSSLPDHKEGTVGLGDMVDKAKDLVGGNKEAVKGGIDKAADAADKATGGKATDKIESGAEQAKKKVDDQT
jgi:hypothetical protein